MLSRASSSPAGAQPPPFEVAPRFEHAEHPVELPGQALVPGRRPRARGGRPRVRCGRPAHAAAQRGVGPGAPCSGCAAMRGFERRRRGRVRRRPAARRRRSGSRRSASATVALERLAARRERPRQVEGRDLADRPAEVVRTEPHEVAPGGQREHAVAAAAPLLLQHDDLAAAPRREHDVAGPERFETRLPSRLAARLAGRVELGEEPAVLRDVAAPGPRPRCAPGRAVRAAVRAARSSDDDVAVGVVLREREVQEVTGLLGRIPPHEVGGHVVRRPERRRERVRAPRREAGDLFERDERVPEHDDVAAVVDAAPAGAARELGVLPRRQELVVLAGELRQLLDHDRPRAAC